MYRRRPTSSVQVSTSLLQPALNFLLTLHCVPWNRWRSEFKRAKVTERLCVSVPLYSGEKRSWLGKILQSYFEIIFIRNTISCLPAKLMTGTNLSYYADEILLTQIFQGTSPSLDASDPLHHDEVRLLWAHRGGALSVSGAQGSQGRNSREGMRNDGKRLKTFWVGCWCDCKVLCRLPSYQE